MNNEKFFNTYVEILTSTFHDAIGKNIVFQTQAKINGEEQEELKRKIQFLENKIEEYGDTKKYIEEKEAELLERNEELENLQADYDKVKQETNHLITFKNQIVSARQEIIKIKEDNEKLIMKLKKDYEKKIDSLQKEVDYLKMTPSQRKKFNEKNKSIPNLNEKISIIENANENTTESVVDELRDGGIF